MKKKNKTYKKKHKKRQNKKKYKARTNKENGSKMKAEIFLPS